MSSTRYYPYALDNTAGRQTVSDLSNDHIQFGVGISSDFQITGVTTFIGSLTLTSSLIDVKGQVGSAGSILASTGSGIDWISPSTTSVDNATKVGTNLNATDADQWVAFLGASSGNNPIRVDNALRYNPVGSQGTLKVDGDILVESDIGGGSHRRTQIAPGAIDLARENSSIDFKTGVAEDFDCRIIQNSNGLDFLTGGDGNTSTVLSLTGNKEVQLKHVGNEKLITTSTGITVTGTATVDGVHLGDDDKITLGNSPSDADLEIFHSTSSGGFSVIRDIGAGQLVIGGSAIEFKSADIATSWAEIDSSGIKINSGKLETTDIEISGTLKDGESTPSAGTAGQVLSSTSTSIKWVNAGELSAGAASQVSISNDNDDAAERFVLFCDSATGNQSIKSDATFKFNPSTNALTAGSFIRNGGSSSQFLKADGSVDSNTYLTTESDTTYDLSAVDSSNDIILRLDPSSGSNDDIKIVAGSNVTLTHDSATQFTITTQNDNTTDPTNLGNSATGSSFTITSSTGSNTNLPAATTSAWGMMTDEDKSKLNAIESGATSDQTSTDIKTLLASDKLTNTHIATLNQNTSGNAATSTTASTVTVANETSDGSCSILFVNDATGNLAPKTNSLLTFSSLNGMLTASKLSGNGANVTNVNANSLDGLDSAAFVRSDQADNADGPLTIGGSTTFDSNTILQVTNTNAGPNFVLNRNDTSVSANQVIGAIRATGNDSNGTIQESASIEFKADLDHGTNDKPGRIEFRTTSDGGSSAQERLSINSAGNVSVTGNLTVSGTINGGSTGKVLKYQTMNDSTARTFSANTWSDCGLSINYTPVSSNSRILITAYINIWGKSPSDSAVTSRGDAYMRILEGSNVLGEQQYCTWGLSHSSTYQHYVTEKMWQFTFYQEHSNSNTSARTYKMQLYEETGVLQMNDGPGSLNDGLSYFTVMEIGN